MTGMNKISKLGENGKIHNIQCTILRSLLPQDKKIVKPRISFRVKKKWHWQSIWSIMQNMCRCIIHAWRISLHCIICTSGWHTLSSHHHCNLTCRSPNYFCLRHLQCLSEYHFTQSCRKSLSKFTTYIPGMVQKKMAK